VKANPIMLPKKDEGQCKKYARIAVHVDLEAPGRLFVQRREQFEDKDDANRDFNDMGGYELCHGKELLPPASKMHCSVGSRMNEQSPCLTRLEQLTYDEAHAACHERGGQLAKIHSLQEALDLQKFGDRKDLGIGLRDFGADNQWRFDNGSDATDLVGTFEQGFASHQSHRRRRAANDFRSKGCIMVASSSRKGPVLLPLDCAAKVDWVCEGTLANPPESTLANPVNGQALVHVKGDLMADEGAFCLFHAHEPVDLLPNDEGQNFQNTDLQCDLQVSSRQRRQCEFNPSSRRRGLVTKRGNMHNGINYPVRGSTIGWSGSKANITFLKLENADDTFHCHYSPNNNGLLRTYAMQHMFDRNYVGSMKRTCGCGYKYLAQLVSRCDCTRSGARDNNCAKWHSKQLTEVTSATNPVRCNNCNANDNL